MVSLYEAKEWVMTSIICFLAFNYRTVLMHKGQSFAQRSHPTIAHVLTHHGKRLSVTFLGVIILIICYCAKVSWEAFCCASIACIYICYQQDTSNFFGQSRKFGNDLMLKFFNNKRRNRRIPFKRIGDLPDTKANSALLRRQGSAVDTFPDAGSANVQRRPSKALGKSQSKEILLENQPATADSKHKRKKNNRKGSLCTSSTQDNVSIDQGSTTIGSGRSPPNKFGSRLSDYSLNHMSSPTLTVPLAGFPGDSHEASLQAFVEDDSETEPVVVTPKSVDGDWIVVDKKSTNVAAKKATEKEEGASRSSSKITTAPPSPAPFMALNGNWKGKQQESGKQSMGILAPPPGLTPAPQEKKHEGTKREREEGTSGGKGKGVALSLEKLPYPPGLGFSNHPVKSDKVPVVKVGRNNNQDVIVSPHGRTSSTAGDRDNPNSIKLAEFMDLCFSQDPKTTPRTSERENSVWDKIETVSSSKRSISPPLGPVVRKSVNQKSCETSITPRIPTAPLSPPPPIPTTPSSMRSSIEPRITLGSGFLKLPGEIIYIDQDKCESREATDESGDFKMPIKKKSVRSWEGKEENKENVNPKVWVPKKKEEKEEEKKKEEKEEEKKQEEKKEEKKQEEKKEDAADKAKVEKMDELLAPEETPISSLENLYKSSLAEFFENMGMEADEDEEILARSQSRFTISINDEPVQSVKTPSQAHSFFIPVGITPDGTKFRTILSEPLSKSDGYSSTSDDEDTDDKSSSQLKKQKNPAWSIGAEKHFEGKCQPCGFYYKKECRNGSECVYCHMCPKTELKRRKKDKVAEMRRDESMKQQQQKLPKRKNGVSGRKRRDLVALSHATQILTSSLGNSGFDDHLLGPTNHHLTGPPVALGMGLAMRDVEGMPHYGDWGERAYWGAPFEYDNLSSHLNSANDSRSGGMNASDPEYLSSI